MSTSGSELATNLPNGMSKRSEPFRNIPSTDALKNIVAAAGLSVFALMCVAVPGIANATLGESVQSTEADRASMLASMRMLPSTNFTVHELQLPSGTKLREFVSPSGVVFAIAWRGPTIPNLKQVLGRYFQRYAANENRQGGLHNRVVSDPDFVVQSSGHMRLFTGRAFVPQLLPPGVTVDQIQ